MINRITEIVTQKNQELQFKQTLPSIDTVTGESKDIDKVKELMTQTIDTQTTLDNDTSLSNREAHRLAHIVMNNVIELESYLEKFNQDGFRYGNIIFGLCHQIINGKHDFKRVIEVLPEEKI